MKKTEEKTVWFFVDESGDPVFYGKGGKVIVGQEGCSRVFLLGFVQTENPQIIRDTLGKLRSAVAADPYLKDILSVRKSLFAFHAKDDCAEVRMQVYKTLADLDFSVQVMVARKIEPMFRTRFQGSQDRFYEDLTSRLFENVLHKAAQNEIVFSRRGKKMRQHALRSAIQRGVERFRLKWKPETITDIQISTTLPSEEPVLQVIDYANWAVQRAFERGEMRYFDFLRDKYALVCDVFDHNNYKNGRNFYDRTRNPFDIKKASPLG